MLNEGHLFVGCMYCQFGKKFRNGPFQSNFYTKKKNRKKKYITYSGSIKL